MPAAPPSGGGGVGHSDPMDLATARWLASAEAADALAVASDLDEAAHARAAAGDGRAVDPLVARPGCSKTVGPTL